MKDDKKDKDIEKLKEQCGEYLNGWKRAKADLINYKKEVEKRSQELREFMMAGVVLDILPIHDHFKKALSHAPLQENEKTKKQYNPSTPLGVSNNITIEQSDNEAVNIQDVPKEFTDWFEGIKHIKSQLDKFLKDRGVAEIKTIGEKFNPELHEAVSKRKVEGTESDIILEEVSSGYKMNGKVIMPAKVVVSE